MLEGGLSSHENKTAKNLHEARRKSQDAIRIADINLGDPLDPGRFNSEIFSAGQEKSLRGLPKKEAPPQEPSTADMLQDIITRMSGVKKRKPPTAYH